MDKILYLFALCVCIYRFIYFTLTVPHKIIKKFVYEGSWALVFTHTWMSYIYQWTMNTKVNQELKSEIAAALNA